MSASCKAFTSDLNLKLHNLIKAIDDPQIQTVESLIYKLVGDNNAGIMLRRLIYWFPRAKKFGNWVYKSWKDWYAETNLTRNQTKRVHREGFLERIGITRQLMKANGAPTNHYRLDPQKFLAALADFFNTTVEEIRRLMHKSDYTPAAKPQSTRTERATADDGFAGQSWADYADTDDDPPAPPSDSSSSPQSIDDQSPNASDADQPMQSASTTQSITALTQQTKNDSQLETDNGEKPFSFLKNFSDEPPTAPDWVE